MKLETMEKTFSALFLDSLRETLGIMIDEEAAKSFLAHLEEDSTIGRSEIAENQEAISRELEKVFGVGAARIEEMVGALLFSKVGLKFEKKGCSLSDYVKYAKVHGTISSKPPSSAKLDSIDIQIIDSLRQDARKPVLQISKEINISRPTIINRLNNLIESNILSLNAGLNLSELGFKTSLISLEAKNSKARQEVEKLLHVCPRVLMLLRPTEKANMIILLYGENQSTLDSTIETIRSINDTELFNVHNSDPPLFLESFPLNIYPIKGDVTPCGKKCIECLHFQEGQCLGCPAVTAYKGQL